MTSSNRLFPSFDEIRKLAPEYKPEDYSLTRYLDEKLPKEWEIYFEPFFNGSYPDLVILNPGISLTIFRTQHWLPGEIDIEKSQVLNKKTNKYSEVRKYYRGNGKNRVNIPDPIAQVSRYRSNLINYYCPFIGEEANSHSNIFAAFKTGLFFTNLSTSQAHALVSCNEKECAVFGMDAIEQNLIDIIVPDHDRKNSIAMPEDWVEPIRFWLFPPIHPLDNKKKEKLNPKQKEIAEPSPQKHMKVRGVIGSGKTLLIAQRAAKLASKGKKVLVVTFNITLWHYIKYYIEENPLKFEWKYIEFQHFHGFCRDFLLENDIVWPASDPDEDIDDTNHLDEFIPQKVIEAIKNGKNNNNRRYDAILIDEGQDFCQSWYQALCSFLSNNDELLLVVDEKQNVYKRNQNWIGSDESQKLKGDWVELKESYRIPPQMLNKILTFSKEFLPEIGIEAEPFQLDIGFNDPNWVWLETNDFAEAQERIWNCFLFLTKELKVPNQDIVIMVPSHKEGWLMVQKFLDQKIPVNHMFEDENHSHQNKKTFWIKDPRLKITTIHSFKGWELSNVIFLTPNDKDKESSMQDSLFYTAMSRTRQNLIVFNRMSRYKTFGESWLKYWQFPVRLL